MGLGRMVRFRVYGVRLPLKCSRPMAIPLRARVNGLRCKVQGNGFKV